MRCAGEAIWRAVQLAVGGEEVSGWREAELERVSGSLRELPGGGRMTGRWLTTAYEAEGVL